MKVSLIEQKQLPPAKMSRGPTVSFIPLFFLLPVPLCAVSALTAFVDWKILAGALITVSSVSYLLCRSDKKRAELGEWRTPESLLHFLELIGGWPGAYIAQRKFRHKVAKGSYQFEFWAIVILHELIALDSLCGWRMSNAVLHLAQR